MSTHGLREDTINTDIWQRANISIHNEPLRITEKKIKTEKIQLKSGQEGTINQREYLNDKKFDNFH